MDIRHCDRKGCLNTESCEGSAFLSMSRTSRTLPLLRFCSWDCLSEVAAEHARWHARQQCEMCRDSRFVRWRDATRGFVHLDRFRTDHGPACGDEPLCQVQSGPQPPPSFQNPNTEIKEIGRESARGVRRSR